MMVFRPRVVGLEVPGDQRIPGDRRKDRLGLLWRPSSGVRILGYPVFYGIPIDLDCTTMGHILHPLLALLASASQQELARQVAYLKEEYRILRARLPERIVATPRERRRLIRAGRGLGTQLKELISFVSYQTFQRWIRETARVLDHPNLGCCLPYPIGRVAEALPATGGVTGGTA